MCRARTAVISVGLIAAVLALSTLIYSPWHRHSALSRQACIFAQFEQLSGVTPSAGVEIEPPAVCLCFARECDTARPVVCHFSERFGRAPPA